MKHLAMILPTIDQIGGAERQVLLLCQALRARGWKVTLLTLSGDGARERQTLAADQVSYHSLGMRKAWIDPRGWVRFGLWWWLERPDVLHAHLPHACWFARWSRLLFPVPVLVDTLHTSAQGGRTRQWGYRLSQSLSDWTTCVSQTVLEAASSTGVVCLQKVSVVPNGVFLPANLPRIRPTGTARFRWIAVGRLATVKDYPTMLRAFAQLAPQAHLTIAGTGCLEPQLQALIDTLGIRNRVAMLGYRAEVGPLLEQADALVLSSLWEGLPVCVIEAASYGLPVVATEGAGTREAMLDGRSGLVVPVGQVAELAQAMTAIMQMPVAERLSMGAIGRQLVEERFSITTLAAEWEQLYCGLLQSSAKPHRWACR